MAQLQYVVACVFVLFLYVQQGYSLKCYICNSHNDTACMQDKPPSHYAIECKEDTHKPILCRKIKQMIDFEVNGLQADTRIIRGCGWYNASLTKHCYQRSGFGGRQEVCACDTELCNTSTTLIASSSLLLGLVYAIIKISH